MNEIEAFQRSVNISSSMLIITLIVAIATITFGALNMAFQRSHNIKSVRPFCNIHKHMSIADGRISIMIANAGLGPMIIKKIVVKPKGNDEEQMEIELSGALPRGLQYDVVLSNADLYVLPSKEEITLFQFSQTAGAGTPDDIDRLQQELGKYILCIYFQDIYEHDYEKKELINF